MKMVSDFVEKFGMELEVFDSRKKKLIETHS